VLVIGLEGDKEEVGPVLRDLDGDGAVQRRTFGSESSIRPAAASAALAARSSPPVASSTIAAGASARARSTSVAMPAASLATCEATPSGLS
jgi:hypothetical protein